MRVKIFDEEHEQDLEEVLNEFLQSLPHKSITDIKYQVAVGKDMDGSQIYCFSALVMYEEKRHE
ncbi:sporulation protein Cse60 [Priestia koreensis]|uniref:Sporulation protein cse60 n=1 Tax=Priestia koreensis TaxID=284581 RepID=A0A0M0L6T2_9BACI|nr:sporulation protein Cse60 [Priestia koreensis]KOO46785.1 sporulation protein cse60 [Priestia koreensis]MCM3002857.1 sporulation protein Cse60 [Priestia koreensis]UNL84545.1 sporulation protein Cse60 [Priestia koreensis]